jgi:hypothetical protein
MYIHVYIYIYTYEYVYLYTFIYTNLHIYRNIPSPRIIADMSYFPSSLAIRELIMLKTPQDTDGISNRVTLEIVY